MQLSWFEPLLYRRKVEICALTAAEMPSEPVSVPASVERQIAFMDSLAARSGN